MRSSSSVVPGLVGPRERGAKVVVLGLDTLDPVRLLGAAQHAHLGVLGELREVLGVATPQLIGFAALVQALERVGADRLEHPEAIAVGTDEAVLRKRLEREDVDMADRVRGGEREATREDAQASEGLLSGRIEQLVAPVDRGAKRAMALGEVARAAREQGEAVGEPFEQLLGRESTDACCGQLQCEGKTVEGGAELRDGAVGCEVGPNRRRTFREQRHRRLARKTAERELALASQPQRYAASGQHLQTRRRREQARDERRCTEHLLEVVQHEQHRAPDEEALERRLERPCALLHADGVRDRGQREGRLGDRRQLHEDDAVREVEGRPRRHFEREPGLPRPARAGDRHTPHLLEPEQLAQLVHLAFAADDRGRRCGQRQPGARERARRRELRGEVVEDELVEALGLGKVLEPVLAQRPDARPRHERAGRLREQDLAAVSRVGDPRRAMDVEPDVRAARTARVPAVDAHPDAHVDPFGPRVLARARVGRPQLRPPPRPAARRRRRSCRPRCRPRARPRRRTHREAAGSGRRTRRRSARRADRAAASSPRCP